MIHLLSFCSRPFFLLLHLRRKMFMETIPDPNPVAESRPTGSSQCPNDAMRRTMLIVLSAFLLVGLTGIFSRNFLKDRNLLLLRDVSDITEVKVLGVVMDSLSGSPAVFLYEEREDVYLPIWIGANEAVAIQAELSGVKSPRPLTNDLLKDIMITLNATLEKIIITKVQDDTYYAQLNVKGKDGSSEIDARPSDAIGLAIRFQCPIFVSNKVLKEYGISSGDAANKRIGKIKKI